MLFITKLIDIYSKVFLLFCLPLIFISIKAERHFMAKRISSHGEILRVIFPLLWLTKFYFVSLQRTQSVLDKNINPEHVFFLLPVIYFQNMFIVTM